MGWAGCRAKTGLGRGWGPHTQDTCLRQAGKPLHDLDCIPQLCRALQLGLGRVRGWQVAIAGQPVLDQRWKEGKEKGLWRGSPIQPPSWKPHLSPAMASPRSPAPENRLLPTSRSRPSSPGFASVHLLPRVPTFPPQPFFRFPNSGPQPPDESKDSGSQSSSSVTLWTFGKRPPPSLNPEVEAPVLLSQLCCKSEPADPCTHHAQAHVLRRGLPGARGRLQHREQQG